MKDRPAHKANALEAISHARKMVDGDAPLSALDRIILRGVLEGAEREVTAIQELKRERKTTGAEPAQS